VSHSTEPPAAEVEPDKPAVLAPPPVLYAGGLALGLILELLVPLPGLPSVASWVLGSVLLVAGVALALWFLSSFRRAGTPVDVRKATTKIVTEGPFRFSRNPGYVSLTAIYAGIAVLADALWPLFLLPGIVLVVERGVIDREERYLERRFGEDYRRYKARTRRWL
jgi:protein-S-isoprenylcysteine O-methyltransferase Ste14